MSGALLNPKTTTIEWGGPLGAAAMMVGLPVIVFVLHSGVSGGLVSFAFGWQHLAAVFCWTAFQALLAYFLPGKRVKGQPLRTGERLEYVMNGETAFFITHSALAALHYLGYIDLRVVAVDSVYFPIAGATTAFALVCSVLLYLYSFRSPKVLLSTTGNTGSMFYDAFVGRELNPRIGAFDLKYFFELRPGLVAWSLLNWCFALKSGMIVGYVLSVMQSVYVWDAMRNEAGNLTMMDITHEGFGYMLMFGDMVWVPFVYTLQCRALTVVGCAVPIPSAVLVPAAILLHCVGWYVFRRANTEKNVFRTTPREELGGKF